MSNRVLQWLGESDGPFSNLSTRFGGHLNMFAAMTILVVFGIVLLKFGTFCSSYLPKSLRAFEDNVERIGDLFQSYKQQLGIFFPEHNKLSFDVQFAQWIADQSQTIGDGWRRKSALKKLRNKVVATAEQAFRQSLGEQVNFAQTISSAKLDGRTSLELFRALTGNDALVAQANPLAIHTLNQAQQGWLRRMLHFRQSRTKTATKIAKILHLRAEDALHTAMDKAKDRWVSNVEPPASSGTRNGQPPLTRSQKREMARRQPVAFSVIMAARQATTPNSTRS